MNWHTPAPDVFCMDRFERLRAWLLARVPARTAALAADVALSTAGKELRRLRLAGFLGDGERAAAERRRVPAAA